MAGIESCSPVDSAHTMVPTGGYGMNTGLGDAFNLGWKLAGLLHGWGGPGLLTSYEAERRPIGDRNRTASVEERVGPLAVPRHGRPEPHRQEQRRRARAPHRDRRS